MSGVKCNLCPHYCTLINGRGFCGAREHNLGKFSAINIDPIEKKPLYHVNPGSETLSLGSVGCNLKCPWCQNYSISREYRGVKLTKLSPNELLFLVKSKNLNSVTFTYNEPSISYEYIVETSKLLSEEDIECNIVSSGYISDNYLESFYKNITAANIDLKCFNKENYKKIIGGDLDTILSRLLYLNRSHTWLEITTLLIPGFNDSDKEVDELIKWIKYNLGDRVPLHFSAYYPTYKMTNPRTPESTIINAVESARSLGLKYVYSGNISGENVTRCPECGKDLIKRSYYTTQNDLSGNRCPHCKIVIDGIFNDQVSSKKYNV